MGIPRILAFRMMHCRRKCSLGALCSIVSVLQVAQLSSPLMVRELKKIHASDNNDQDSLEKLIRLEYNVYRTSAGSCKPDPGPAFSSWIAVPWSLRSCCLTATDEICCMEIHSIIAQNKEFNGLFLRQVAGIDRWELPVCHCVECHACISLPFG